mmetsp:Transcript_12424/g.45939  ORF Transcript_12424/g.45939 Transcript_12424/m.45939 type:complete len:206 (+) Transcript_12424:199-816(+)
MSSSDCRSSDTLSNSSCSCRLFLLWDSKSPRTLSCSALRYEWSRKRLRYWFCRLWYLPHSWSLAAFSRLSLVTSLLRSSMARRNLSSRSLPNQKNPAQRVFSRMTLRSSTNIYAFVLLCIFWFASTYFCASANASLMCATFSKAICVSRTRFSNSSFRRSLCDSFLRSASTVLSSSFAPSQESSACVVSVLGVSMSLESGSKLKL